MNIKDLFYGRGDEPSVGLQRSTEYFTLMDNCEQQGFVKISMGSITTDPMNPSYTYGANPCIAGAVYQTDGGIYIFHSQAEIIPPKLIQLIEQGVLSGGYIGGPIQTHRGIKQQIIKPLDLQVVPLPKGDYQATFAISANPHNKEILYAYNTRESRLKLST